MLIQIVDDSPNMREAIKSVLGELNAAFIESDDGDDAVKQFASRMPDLVIMDIRMKRMDGIEATRLIRTFSPNARVIVLTQYNDSDLQSAAQLAGAIGYVLKDDLSQLLNIIQTIPKGQL
jgi:DNA-binding NarL/FixJ family response regulator